MSIKKYDNQSNIFSTNIFETCIGVTNIAPIKISGQYKIVVSLDGNLYLDDYTGRRSMVDKNLNFLNQVSNFLKTETNIPDNKVLRYGAFQNSNKKSYHIPLYLGSIKNPKLPKYYILSKVVNDTIVEPNILYNDGEIQQVIDLDKIGLSYIFEQILLEDYYNYPLYFNFEESNILLFGYSLTKEVPLNYKFDITKSLANQSYFEVFNNKILNTFVSEKIIYPRFINIEFEFEYSDNNVFFNNFYGYLSNGEEIQINQISNNNFNIKLQDYNDKIIWKQQKVSNNINNPIILNNYEKIVSSGSIQETHIQKEQIRFLTSRLSINDTLIIKNNIGNIDFKYIVKDSDINSNSLYASFTNICKLATKQSKNKYIFSVIELSNQSCEVKIIKNYSSINNDLFTIKLPFYYTILDRFSNQTNINKFRGIKENDVLLGRQLNLHNVDKISINNINYDIVEIFKYNDKTIVRLNNNPNINQLTQCKIFENQTEKLIKFEPISFLNFNSKLKSDIQFNQNKYTDNLLTLFGNSNDYQSDIDKFNKIIENGIYQYNRYDLKIIDDIEKIEIEDYNTEICMNMLFNSVGQTAFLTPNILNIDKKFYIQNGNVDPQNPNDYIKYNWFLIKGNCPDYLKNTINKLRYFGGNNDEQIPKITSTIFKINNDYCETIFLGVKYKLPIKYTDYQFAVYLDFTNQIYKDITYKFEVNNSEKTLYLSVNKYLDFVDLIKGGNNDNQPLLDLSFFYSINNSFNSNSEYVLDFKTCSLKFCEEFNDTEPSIYFEGQELRQWYYTPDDVNYFITLRLNLVSDNNINDLRLIFSAIDVEQPFYVYGKAIYNGVQYDYIVMEIIPQNIQIVNETYLWCSDIKIKLFDEEKIQLQKYNEETNLVEIFEVNKADLTFINISNNFIFGDLLKTVNYDNKEFTVLTNQPIYLKENYFEILQEITEGSQGEKIQTKNVFYFKDTTKFSSNLHGEETVEDMLINFFDFSNDTTVTYSKITLFDRNQLWKVIKSLFKYDLKFKNSTKELIRLYIDKFKIDNLISFSNSNFIPIKNSDDLININIIDIDKNVVIWNIYDIFKIYLCNRFKTAYFPYLELFENEKDFQLNQYKQYNSLFNIYDKNFGGLGISGTGLWNEVEGNIVSSLFCKENDIVLNIDFLNQVNYKKLLIEKTNVENLIITDWNIDYIKKINQNVNEYIIEKYVDYLLNKFYSLFSVENEFGQKLNYSVDFNDDNLLYFKPVSTYIKSFEKLIFTFKRK